MERLTERVGEFIRIDKRKKMADPVEMAEAKQGGNEK
jgi:hypothetical protein